jgi:peptidoglycan/xylan/chitin deacetylase (PgdA/CDA1 family)
MPRLLDLYEKYNVKATFFYTGYIAGIRPEVVTIALGRGHEIASHGLTHKPEKAFDVLPYEVQVEHLLTSKKIIEQISGEKVVSFRAPAARVDKNIASALAEAGYLVDSSVSSQRLDMFMSFGALKKLNWLSAPRKPYFTDPSDIFRKGSGPILEIPISALIFPYIGTFMRISPMLNRVTRNMLAAETRLTGRPFNFLTHPNEFIDEELEEGKIQRRATNYFSYLLGDVLRHKLKVRNLGEKALPILEKELKYFSERGYKFVTCKEYLQIMKHNNAGK